MLTWTPPSTTDEAFDRRRELRAEIQVIEAQLGDRLRRAKATADPESDEYERYWSWNQSARWALANKLEELRLIKGWITENRDIFA